MKVEYIASGMSYIRIVTNGFLQKRDCVDITNKFISDLQDQGNFDISCLFNGYTEADHGEKIVPHFPAFKNIFVDSGGLQVITLGKEVTDSVKDKIYEIQGTWGTVAMSFDEIPVITREGGSKRGDTTGRMFSYDILEECAILSGKNLDEQIEAFKRMDSKTKPMLIAQGNDRFTISEWVDIVYNTVKPENRKYIHGIAFAFSSLGSGTLESVEVCAAYQRIKHESLKKNIHLLGVGAIRKMVPFIESFRAGIIDPDTNISIDSTSHSSSVVMGFFQGPDLKVRRIGKYPNSFNREYLKLVYDTILKYHTTNIGFEEFYDYSIKNISTSTHLKEETDLNILANLLYPVSCFLQARYLIDGIRDCYNNPESYSKYLNKKTVNSIRPLLTLDTVKNQDDMENWISKYSKYIDSSRIRNNKESIITLF